MTKLEKEIENSLRKMVVKHGGFCLKWVCPGWSGVPDRIILLPEGHIVFVETKRPKGGVYSPMQDKWAEWLTRLGFDYYRVKDTEQLHAFELILLDMVNRR